MPKKDQLTPAEIQRYYRSQQLTRETLVDSISVLKKRNRRRIPEAEHAENSGKIADLEADKIIIDAKRTAFDANKSAIEPPTDPQLDRLHDLVEAVEKLTAEAKVVDEVIALTGESLATFNQIQQST